MLEETLSMNMVLRSEFYCKMISFLDSHFGMIRDRVLLFSSRNVYKKDSLLSHRV